MQKNNICNPVDEKSLKELRSKLLIGDWVTIGKMVGASRETTRMRFNRGDEDTVEAVKNFIEFRDSFIEQYKSYKA